MHVGFPFPSHPGFVGVEVFLAMGGDVAPLALRDLADGSVQCLVTEVLLMMLYLHIPEAIMVILIGIFGGGVGLLSSAKHSPRPAAVPNTPQPAAVPIHPPAGGGVKPLPPPRPAALQIPLTLMDQTLSQGFKSDVCVRVQSGLSVCHPRSTACLVCHMSARLRVRSRLSNTVAHAHGAVSFCVPSFVRPCRPSGYLR